MAVDITTLGWGTVQDRFGNALAGTAFSIKDASNVVVLSGTLDANGQIVGSLDQGTYTLTVGATVKTVEVVPSSVVSSALLGAVSGVATLDSTTHLTLAQLPTVAARTDVGQTFTVAQAIDIGTTSSCPLTITKNNSTNTDGIRLQNLTTGGRVGLIYRDETGKDLARCQAHNASDPGSTTSQYVIYTARTTPRAGGALHEARFLMESESDFPVQGFYCGTFQVNTHDADGNLNADQTGVIFMRSPADQANESSEFVRSRSSGNGSNYIHRNLAAADTAGPLLKISNDNAGDDQTAVAITNVGTGSGVTVTQSTTLAANNTGLLVTSAANHTNSGSNLFGVVQSGTGSTRPAIGVTNAGSSNALRITNTGSGAALAVSQNDTGGANASIDISRTGNSASKIGGLKIAATNAGAGGVYGIQLATDLAFEMGTATGTGKSYLEMWEQSGAPSAPAANSGRMFLQDNGAGKTQLCILFASGAAIVLATEL